MAILLRILLPLASLLCAILAQNADPPKKSVWEEPIRFSTKEKDSCLLHVSGQDSFTKLRISCRNQAKSYYCDFQGKPSVCRQYNTNPRHYFTQIMWDLRKLPNACQGPRLLRAHMCKKAPEEAHMAFVSSWPKPGAPKQPAKITYDRTPQQAKPPATTKPVAQKPAAKLTPAKPALAKPAAKAPQPRKTTPKPSRTSSTARPTEPSGETRAVRLAQQYCWRSLQGVCAYFISWFHRK